MGQRGLFFRVFALCVTTVGVNLLAACGHDDGGQPSGPVRAAQWARTYGGASSDVANAVQPTADGGYILAGSTRSFGAGGEDAWLVKLDANGNVLWQKTYRGPIDSAANFVQRSADGGYVVAGSSWDLADPGRGIAWVMKNDGNGGVIWQRTFGGSGRDVANSVEPTADGGYILAGYTSSFGAGGRDAWLVKLDANGNVLWQKTYGGPDDDAANSVKQSTDGGYIVAGSTLGFEGKVSTIPWVLKLDALGNVVWQKVYVVGDPANGARSVQQTTDGGYIVAGYTNAYYFHGGISFGDVWVLKLNAAGDVVWQRRYTAGGREEAYSLALTPDGGYVVAGFTEGQGYPGPMKALLLKLDAAGSVVWSKTFGGSKARDAARFLRVTPDGGYVLAGNTESFGAGDRDAWVLKLDANGAITGCTSMAETNVTTVDTTATTGSSTATATDTNATPKTITFNPADSTGVVSEQCRYE